MLCKKIQVRKTNRFYLIIIKFGKWDYIPPIIPPIPPIPPIAGDGSSFLGESTIIHSAVLNSDATP